MQDIPLAARCYVLAVGISGSVLLVLTLRRAEPIHDVATFVLFLLLAVLGEFRLIKAPLGAEGVDLTFSTAFAFALLIAFGAPYAALGSVIASLLGDLISRKSWWKAMFNATQFVFVAVVSGAVFRLIAGVDHLDPATAFSHPRDLIAAVAAAVTYFSVNTWLLSVAIGLAQRTSVFRLLREESGWQLMGSLGMLGLAPIAVIASGRTPWLIPILLIPLGVIYRSTVVSVEKQHEALHDSLTGLPNRALFRLRAIDAMTLNESDGESAAVMLIDLDRFKEINDTLGHGTGDLVLQELGPRLLEAAGDEHTVARLGGDEFGVVLRGLAGVPEAEAIAERILEAVRQPITLDGLDLEVGASIGISVQGLHGDDADTLIQRADIAMYAAKESGSGHATYSAQLDHTSPMRLGLVSELRQAIESSALVVHYQPKVVVATGLACGVEALVRWEHPTRGLVSPDEFIPIAEQSGLIGDLTRFVLREAIEASARWRRRGYDLSCSVNISARTLHDLDLPATIANLVETHAVPASSLILEITESTIMADPVRAVAALEQLRSIGVQVSMDDYGTGHSSLAQMKNLPIDELKIDKSFIMEMTEQSSDALIAASTVDLARRLGLRVVAEGVETVGAWTQLHEMGCDQAQGYHFGRPVPEAQLMEWLVENERRGALGAGPTRSTSMSTAE